MVKEREGECSAGFAPAEANYCVMIRALGTSVRPRDHHVVMVARGRSPQRQPVRVHGGTTTRPFGESEGWGAHSTVTCVRPSTHSLAAVASRAPYVPSQGRKCAIERFVTLMYRPDIELAIRISTTSGYFC